MASSISYKSSVFSDIKKLDKSTARRILNKLEKALSEDPDLGIPLAGEFKGLFRYRIGDYRVIYTKTTDGALVLRIAHRRDIYRIR